MQFDQLVKHLSTTRLTRLTALRGLVAGSVAALTGVALPAEQDAAADGKKKRRRRRNRKKTVCNCTGAQASSCTTQKLGKNARRQLLASNLCAYAGGCRGVSGCPGGGTTTTTTTTTTPAPVPGFTCTTDTECPERFQACFGNACGPCNQASDCDAESACLNGRCIASSGPNAIDCPSENAAGDAVCNPFSNLLECHHIAGTGATPRCLLNNECPPANNPSSNPCPGGTFCVLGECTQACAPNGSCPKGEVCVDGLCFET